MNYNLQELLETDKKEVQLLNGDVINMTFTPLVVNTLYSKLMDEQIKMQKFMAEYKKNVGKLKNGENKEVEEYLKNSEDVSKQVQELSASVQEKIKQILVIILEHNNNEIEDYDSWYEERTQQEVAMLLKIVFNLIEDNKKK